MLPFNEIIQSKSKLRVYRIWAGWPLRMKPALHPALRITGISLMWPEMQPRMVWSLISADATYGLKRKYYINVGVRRDGSSRLTEDHAGQTLAR